ncbi:acyl-CoA dehydrogenase family member 11-like [Acanthaster planci]|uniref:Acyl-CoA dehydrogenase family member 11-like n=1 Tax=Acanthaster planci TaxID=133434 RepID=A0A8B7ZME1_ACAPL|nr:acyl-CoA dehydrogenase family member 11-like [Acanthaster planci]
MIHLLALRLAGRALQGNNVKWMETTWFAGQLTEGLSCWGATCKHYHTSVPSYMYQETRNERPTVKTGSERSPPFAKALLGTFIQVQPSLDNVYREDQSLRDYLQRLVPEEILKKITPDLDSFGFRVAHEIDKLGRECEQNPPVVETFDAWGNRTDKLITSYAWKQQKTIVAEEGIIAIPFEQEYGPYRFAAKHSGIIHSA